MEEERRQQLSSSSSSILLLHDALIVTMDPQRRVFRNGAVAVQGDTVIAIGQSQDIISQFASLSPQLLNLHGQFLLPGPHTHTHTTYTEIEYVAIFPSHFSPPLHIDCIGIGEKVKENVYVGRSTAYKYDRYTLF